MAASRAAQSNIEIIFADWLDAMRRGDLETMASRLAPDVVHQGVKPEWICHNRQEVIDMVGQRIGRVPPVEAIEWSCPCAASESARRSMAMKMRHVDRRPSCTRSSMARSCGCTTTFTARRHSRLPAPCQWPGTKRKRPDNTRPRSRAFKHLCE